MNLNIARIGRSEIAHYIEVGHRIVECGAGLGRGTRMNSPVSVIKNAQEHGYTATCSKCVKMHGEGANLAK